MKPVDIVLSLLTLSAIGMGVAVYRAYFPGHSEVVSYSDPVQSEPWPYGLVPQDAVFLYASRDSCRQGYMYFHAPGGDVVLTQKGRPVRCLMPLRDLTPAEASEQIVWRFLR